MVTGTKDKHTEIIASCLITQDYILQDLSCQKICFEEVLFEYIVIDEAHRAQNQAHWGGGCWLPEHPNHKN